MQQKQLMILVAVLVVVVIAIVAVVLLMGNKPATGPGVTPGVTPPVTPGVTPGGISPVTPGGIPPVMPAGGNTSGGGAPSGGGGTPAGGNTGGATGGNTGGGAVGGANLNFAGAVECDITIVTQSGTMTENVKMEAPKKMKAIMTVGGVQTTMITADGVTFYMNNPQVGWMKVTATQQQNTPDPATIQQQYTAPPAGVTYNCRNIGDIPDSEFALPADAQVLDLNDLAAAYGGTGA